MHWKNIKTMQLLNIKSWFHSLRIIANKDKIKNQFYIVYQILIYDCFVSDMNKHMYSIISEGAYCVMQRQNSSLFYILSIQCSDKKIQGQKLIKMPRQAKCTNNNKISSKLTSHFAITTPIPEDVKIQQFRTPTILIVQKQFQI